MDWSIIDAPCGGAIGDMTPFEARCLIEKMASNSQQFNARSGDAIVVRGVHDVGTNAASKNLQWQEFVAFAPQVIIIVICVLLCLSQEL
ncbi:hypothetical protein Lal_00046848, partial [Lupinus albus]